MPDRFANIRIPDSQNPARVDLLTSADLYRKRDELVAAEMESFERWRDMDVEDRDVLLILIRETMLRLLEDPFWIPNSLRPSHFGGDRVDVTFTVALEGDVHAMSNTTLERLNERFRQNLLTLRERLGAETPDS